MKRSIAASILTISALCRGLNGLPARAEMPDAPVTTKTTGREHYLVEILCDPTDRAALTSSLRAALALREDGSTVTIFIESTAVLIADPSVEVQPPDALAEIERLFVKVRTIGVTVLVCPHCTEQYSISEKSFRAGLRLTDKEELDAERIRAHKIYQFRSTRPAEATEPVVGCQTD